MLRTHTTAGSRSSDVPARGKGKAAGRGKVSRRQARAWLLEANRSPEYHAAIRTSGVWDDTIAALLSQYQEPALPPTRFTYRQACRRVSWQYWLTEYGRFTRTRPSVWRMLRTYRAWRQHFVLVVTQDQVQNAFTGADEWLNRGPEVLQRHRELRRAQLDDLSSRLEGLMRDLSPFEQFQVRCSVAVVCRTRQCGSSAGQITPRDLLGVNGIAPLRPIER